MATAREVARGATHRECEETHPRPQVLNPGRQNSRPPSPVPRPPFMPNVLIVEDELSIRDSLAELFDVDGTRVVQVGSLDDAKQALAAEAYQLILSDIRLGGKRDGGLQVMAAAGLLSPDAVVIALTAFPHSDNRLASERLGATHFLEKPVDLETIASIAAKHGVASSLFPHPASTAEKATPGA